MPRASKLERLTDHALAMHEARTYDDLSAVAVDAMNELVRCDWTAVSLAPSISPKPEMPRVWTSRQRGDWEAAAQRTEALAQDDPVYTARLRLTLEGAAAYTDYVSVCDFKRSRVYNDVWRPLGTDHVLTFHNPGHLALGLLAGRSGAKLFSSEEAAIVHAIGRHLDSAAARLAESSDGCLLIGGRVTPVSSSVWLVCDAAGTVVRAMPGAKPLLRRCLGPDASLTRVPEEWCRVYRSRRRGGPSEPLRYASPGKVVTVHIAPIRGVHTDEFTVFFVVDRASRDPMAGLMELGLTRREAEVLRWAVEGKTGPEIGVILGISALTAKKHMENVLHKLGVPTRTGAVAIAVSAMRGA